MKAVEFVMLALLGGGGLFLVITWSKVSAWWSRRHTKHVIETAPWRVDTDKQDQETIVQLVKPGEEPYIIGSPIPISLPHYEYDERLTELRLEAHDKADSLNRKLLKS